MVERDGLDRLSREELLELLCRQQEELAEREAAIERRDEKIRALEEELAQYRQPAKTPRNSSVPPPRSSGQAGGRRRIGWNDGGDGSSDRSGGTHSLRSGQAGEPTAQRAGRGGEVSPRTSGQAERV